MNIKSLIRSYKQTLFLVDGFKKPVMVGTKSPEVDQFLEKESKSSWAFITAYNPMSNIEPDNVNNHNHHLLKSDIQEYLYICGHGKDPNDKWVPEPSFFIVGISKSDAISLGKTYGQLAIVYGEIDKKSELLILAA